MVFDGELLCQDEHGNNLDRKTGNGILNKAVKGTQSVEEGETVGAVLWDLIPLTDFEARISRTTYQERLKDLLSRTNPKRITDKRVTVVQSFTVNNIDEVNGHFNRYLADGLEGVILKSKTMIWEDKRSKHQVKFKAELECDLEVIEWQEGTGKNKGKLGALLCKSADGKVQVGVGTGFTDADRKNIGPDVVGSIVAVKYNARINDKRSNIDSLFLPVFVELRSDKDEADSSDVIK